MRGATLFSELITTDDLPEKQVKGRSKSLIEKRNELLLNRYYYLMRNFRFGYESILDILEEEFFISTITIPQINEKPANRTFLHKLKQNPPTKKQLEERWPHIVWDAKEILQMYGARSIPKKQMVA